jgi:ABC-2 type transport system permease protein
MILSDVAYVAWRELVKFFRAKTRLLVTVIQPLIWLGLMGNMMQGLTQNPFIEKLLGTGSYLAFMTPGIILMTVLFGGVFAGMSIVWDRRIGYLEKLLAAPISRAAIPLGKMVASAIQGGFQAFSSSSSPWGWACGSLPGSLARSSPSLWPWSLASS